MARLPAYYQTFLISELVLFIRHFGIKFDTSLTMYNIKL